MNEQFCDFGSGIHFGTCNVCLLIAAQEQIKDLMDSTISKRSNARGSRGGSKTKNRSLQ